MFVSKINYDFIHSFVAKNNLLQILVERGKFCQIYLSLKKLRLSSSMQCLSQLTEWEFLLSKGEVFSMGEAINRIIYEMLQFELD